MRNAIVGIWSSFLGMTIKLELDIGFIKQELIVRDLQVGRIANGENLKSGEEEKKGATISVSNFVKRATKVRDMPCKLRHRVLKMQVFGD
ncbi:hypothetical protein OPV22_000643 [Ensete ventricosum]|uniref:Uncharacterized protein n=1 Tax=Ensete ventricosum TaxID=4639 RepID=A0AAV8RUL0_ENSVE|nr:hypothetical protein OPV22_000643 [Ensete ventricosum]